MAVLGNNIFISVSEDGVSRIIAGTRTNEIKTATDTIPISSIYGGKWKENLAGRSVWSISTGFLVLENEEVKNLLKVGRTIQINVVSRDGDKVTVEAVGNAIITEMNMSFGVGKLAQGNCAFLGTGPLVDPNEEEVPDVPTIPGAPILPPSSGDETDPIFTASPAATITEEKIAEWNEKVDKVDGKQLSTEDFTTILKQKLEGLSNYDDTELSEALSTLRGDFDALVSGDTTTAIKTFNEVIAFLDGIQDTQDLSGIIASIEQQIAGKMDKVTLAAVATSGSYNDLSNKPTIPDVSSKQDKLVSGTNIKTINGTSLLGSGNIVISGGGSAQSAFKRGIVEQTQTWTKAADGGYDYTMSNLVEGDIPVANIDLFAASGAVFNEETGYFELNGLVDISYKEMLAINSLDILYSYTSGDMYISPGNSRTARTLYPSISVKQVTNSFIRQIKSIEKLVLTVQTYCKISNTSYAFYNGIDKLKSVNPTMRATDTLVFQNTFFEKAYSLEEVQIQGVANNIGFPMSARLSVETVLFMINKSSATRAFTITLHPTAYVRAIADASVQAALEAHTNVTLASA